jgi:hypothetical protein
MKSRHGGTGRRGAFGHSPRHPDFLSAGNEGEIGEEKSGPDHVSDADAPALAPDLRGMITWFVQGFPVPGFPRQVFQVFFWGWRKMRDAEAA